MAVELAAAYISLVPSFRGGSAAIARELAPTTGAAQKVGSDMGKNIAGGAKGQLAGMGSSIVGQLGVAFAGVQGINFLSGTVDSARDLNETLNKARVIFGSSSGDVEKWATGAAKNIGQSKQQALEAASSFGNMFNQLGIGRDEATRMSLSMTTLASDFASFHNADISEVLIAQQAAFRGEYDSLQRFVPQINAAMVEQEALRQTGKKTTKELTAQERAVATNTLIMEGAGKATGDFARTSGSLANKQRIQAAQWSDLKAKIGNGLIPVMTKLTGLLIKFTNFLERNRAVVIPLAIAIGGALVGALGAMAAAAISAAIASNSLLLPYLAIGAAVAALAYLVIKNWDTIKSAIGAAIDFVKGLIDGLIGFFRQVPGWIGDAFKTVAKVMTAPYRAAFKAIAKLWNNTLGKISFKIPGWVPGIGGKGFSFPKINEDLLNFDKGGVVPGRPGQPQLAVVHGGETVLPVGAGAGVQIHMPIDARGVEDPATIGDVASRQIAWRLGLLGGL